MNKKKGFTLIELLAIIVILAVIAVVTVPLILNIINDAQKNASIDSAYGYKSALEKYYMKKVVENTENDLPNGYKEISELPEDFAVSGESPSEGWVKLNKGIIEEYSLKYNDYVVTKFKDKDVKVSKRNTLANIVQIPDEYKEVEYLESTGTQYIDTEAQIFKNSNNEIVIGFEPTKFYDYVSLWGTTYDNDTFEGWIYSTGKVAGRYNMIRYGTDTLIELNKKYEAKYIKRDNNLYFYVNNELKQSTPPTANDKIVDNKLLLFKSGGDYGKYKLNYLKLYSNNELVRDYVPVIRKEDNKPGLLDLANRTNNLFDGYLEQGGIQDATGLDATLNNRVRTGYIEVEPLTTYTISNTTYLVRPTVHCYDSNKNWIGSKAVGSTASRATIETRENTKYIRYSFMKNPATDNLTVEEVLAANVMLNEGSEALPYEPYGYKFYTNDGTGEFIAGPEI